MEFFVAAFIQAFMAPADFLFVAPSLAEQFGLTTLCIFDYEPAATTFPAETERVFVASDIILNLTTADDHRIGPL